MNRTPLLCLCASLCIAASGFAQTARRSPKVRLSAIEDSIAAVGARYQHALDSLRLLAQQTTASDSDNLENPYYFPLFAGQTFYGFPVAQTLGKLSLSNAAQKVALSRTVDGGHREGTSSSLAPTLVDMAYPPSINEALMQLYTTHPELVRHNLSYFKADVSRNAPKPSSLPAEKAQPPQPPKVSAQQLERWQDFSPIALHISRPNFWTFKGGLSLQFMQYLVSDNWYKGGEDHNSFLTSATLEANYDDKQKVTFTNKLEMKLGFQTSQSDTLHQYKTNADLLRLTNKLGLQAFKHWYYTAMLQTWTQFYPGYHANDTRVYSDFASPIETVFSIGMDYKYKNSKFEISATLSPIAANYKYVSRLALSERYGVDKGKHSKLNLGSTVTINLRWAPTNWFQWSTRFYAFTSYSKMQAEWENTISLRANKYLSTKIFLFPRFDDSAKRKSGQSFFQFNEYLSVGVDLGF